MKGEPDTEEYAFKVQSLARLEALSQQGAIDLFYGDECGVSLRGYVPYGWQFPGEEVSIQSGSGPAVNCFALLARDNRCFFRTTDTTIDAGLVCDYLDQFSQGVMASGRLTVVVLDNASVHQREVKKRRAAWEAKGLYLFFLPVYSPQLNLAETLWRKLKYEWLQPGDYGEKPLLCYRVWQCLSAVGRELTIAFKTFEGTQYV